jgi:hypothetical protein
MESTVEMFVDIAPYLTDPLVLVGFALMLIFGVHRTLIKSSILKPLSAASSNRVVRLLLHYGFAIAIILTLFGFGLAYLKESKRETEVELTRLQAEKILQKHRGSLEYCIRDIEFAFFLDFVFTDERNLGLGIDVYTARMASIPGGLELVHPQFTLPEEFGRFPGPQKLSTTFPDANRCIIDVIHGDFGNFALKDSDGMIHRYVTEYGAKLVREIEKYDPDIEINNRTDW